jgi:ribosomal-protein-alanine N-acetyltransferase
MKLETERLILRELKLSDAPAINSYSKNPKVVKYVPFGPSTIKETKKFIQRTMKDRRKRPRMEFQFAVILKETKQLIGGCNITIQSF